MLKNIGCKITGIDFSQKALNIAKEINGYDNVFCGSIFEFTHADKYFDYIVSLDVFGHIPFEEKDSTIFELKKYLKHDGIMLHGIESGDIGYDVMTKEELRAFLEVDGHAGIESKETNLNRFKNIFKYVDGELRFSIENSAEEYIKQAEYYNVPFDQDLIRYLISLNSQEKMAFNIANGLVQLKLEQMKIPSKDDIAGFLYLRASDIPLNEPFGWKLEKKHIEFTPIIFDNNIFHQGWYDVESNAFRWSDGKAAVFLNFPERAEALEIELLGSPLATKMKPQEVILSAFGKEIASLSIENHGWQKKFVKLINPPSGIVKILIKSSTFCPKELKISEDNRVLGIALRFINVIEQTD
jgi:hypothetical protein